MINRFTDSTGANKRAERDAAQPCVSSSLLERLGMVSADSPAKAHRDEMALLSTRAWTLARGDAILRRFL